METARTWRVGERGARSAVELAGAPGNVLVCGSLYLVGEVLSLRD